MKIILSLMIVFVLLLSPATAIAEPLSLDNYVAVSWWANDHITLEAYRPLTDPGWTKAYAVLQLYDEDTLIFYQDFRLEHCWQVTYDYFRCGEDIDFLHHSWALLTDFGPNQSYFVIEWWQGEYLVLRRIIPWNIDQTPIVWRDFRFKTMLPVVYGGAGGFGPQ